MDALRSAWRVCVVAFCFALVGLGGLLYVVTIFPLLRSDRADAPATRGACASVITARSRWWSGSSASAA
jgi:hypothetical protein